MLPLSRWPLRRLLKCWGVGLLLEGALLLPMFVFLVPPDSPLGEQVVDRAQSRPRTMVLRIDSARTGAPTSPRPRFPQPPEDSFYTVLHWPRHKPLLAGGGRVISAPQRLWWIPALYVGAVPLALLTISGAWLFSRGRRQAATTPRRSNI